MRQAANECKKLRQRGSHQVWQVNQHCKIVVPIHSGDIPAGTLGSIRRQGAHCLGEGWLK